MASATSRLRHTFKYPEDSDSPSASRDELDEEEQESLLSTLTTSATQHDSTFRIVFTALPLLSILPFVYHILVYPVAAIALPTILSVTSLSLTAWDMFSLQTDSRLGRPGKRPSAIFASSSSSSTNNTPSRDTAEGGPLTTYLPYLNAAIAVLLVVLCLLFMRRRDGREGFWLLMLLPGLMLLVVWVVKGVW